MRMQTAIEMLAAAQVRDRAERPPQRKPPGLAVVDPIEWSTFRRNFEVTHSVNQWTDIRGRMELCAAMTGEAARVTHHLKPAEMDSLEAMLAKYEDIFVPPSASQAAKTAFHAGRQGRSESILQFHSRLRDLFLRAYPGVDAESSEILRRQFMTNVSDSRVMDWINMMEPETYHNALNIGQRRAAGLMLLSQNNHSINAMGGKAGGDECWNCQ